MWVRNLVLSLAICLPGAARPAAAAADITLCADSWCPYNCTPGSRHPGFAVELAQEVFGAAGFQVDYQELNWARCIEDTRAGRFTGLIGAIRTDAPDFIFPKMPIGISGDAYASRTEDGLHFTGTASLQGHVLGVVRSYTFSGEIGAYIAAHGRDPSRIEFVSGDGALDKNLAKLVAGRVDVILDDENVLLTAIAAHGLQGRLQVDIGPNVTPVYIALAPADPRARRLADLLDAGIARLRASGRLAAIMAEYNVTDRH